jgi:hypothetical protein
MNTISNIQIVRMDGEAGPIHAIMMGLDIDDPAGIDDFMPTVIEKIKFQRMVSPKDTSMMLITIIGNLTAEAFNTSFAAHAANDKVLGVFMSRMNKADVIHGTKDGKALDRASLLDVMEKLREDEALKKAQEKKWWQFWK